MRIGPVVAVATVCWAATTAAAFAIRPSASDDPVQALTGAFAAGALTHLDLTVGDGSVQLRSAADSASDAVGVHVAIRPASVQAWRKAAALPQASLASDAAGHVLRLSLRGIANDAAEADWTITAPARFSARVQMHDGRVAVAGLSGGVQVSLDSGIGGRAGEIVADVPAGRLNLDLGVGTIDARTSAATFGAVDLHSTVGDAHLFLDGHELQTPHAPGPGHRLRLDGDRASGLSLTVTVGTVQLHIR